ncbi:hypothetical protein C8Q77DRAFT_851411 [Trametes polyzona]|nr:hypothetical protein C8Q77DRAFT_851411 [Trametes polyzona]
MLANTLPFTIPSMLPPIWLGRPLLGLLPSGAILSILPHFDFSGASCCAVCGEHAAPSPASPVFVRMRGAPGPPAAATQRLSRTLSFPQDKSYVTVDRPPRTAAHRKRGVRRAQFFARAARAQNLRKADATGEVMRGPSVCATCAFATRPLCPAVLRVRRSTDAKAAPNCFECQTLCHAKRARASCPPCSDESRVHTRKCAK